MIAAVDAALPYVPRLLASRLLAAPARPLPWIDQVEGTLAMADVSGFTAMSERLAKAGKEGAEQLTDIINSFFGRMLDTAAAYGGDTLTFGGDAILLLFTGDGHPGRAVTASAEMLATMRDMDPYVVRGKRIKLGMSMGAHTAVFPLVAVGTNERAQFLVLGPDTVKTAGAEARAESGDLVITKELADTCGGCQVEPLGGDGLGLLVSHAATGSRPLGAFAAEDKARLAEPLRRYLPPVVADALANGAAPALVDSDHRRVTVAFVNVTGVDALLGEGRAELTSQLQAYSSVLLKLVDVHHGYVVSNDIYTDGFKFIVAFGAPVAHERDSENGARFAIELNEQVHDAGLRLAHRIGLNSGFVFAGDVGAAYRRQYTVMGDAVNLAARLMSATGPGTAMTTCELAHRSGSAFVTAPLEPIRVKGKEQPIDVCLLVSETADRPHVSEIVELPVFGRMHEREMLRFAAERAEEGVGQSVAVVGEAGIGKTRLVSAFAHEQACCGWMVLRSAASEHTSARPFGPWQLILTELLELDAAADPEMRGRALEAAVGRLLPERAELACLLAPMLGAEMPESLRVRELDQSARRAALFRLVFGLLSAQSAAGPLLLFLDDAHWADRSSMDLFEYVATRLQGRRMMLLFTSRPTAEAEARLASFCTSVIHLGELEADASLGIAASILGLDRMPEILGEMLVERSRGNPLFIEELARSLVHQGVVEEIRSASKVRLAQVLEGVDFPDRVQGLLMSRVDRLDPELRDTLRCAAVVGSDFSLEDVIPVAGHGQLAAAEGKLRAEFRKLVALGFVDEQLVDDVAMFRFHHPLIQEVAYGSLRFALRRTLHQRVGEELETRFAEDLDPHLDALVHHFSRSGDDARTLNYAMGAAERASSLFAHSEAVDYYREAARAAKKRDAQAQRLRSELVERIGDAQDLWGRNHDAVASYRDALRRWDRVPADSAGMTAHVLHAAVLCRKVAVSYEREHRRYDLADRWLDRALELMPPGCFAERSHVYTTRGYVALRRGRFADALDWGQQALASAIECDDVGERGWALNMIAGCYRELGEFELAVKFQLESLSYLERTGDLRQLAAGHGNLANCYQMLGRLDEAIAENEASLALYDRLGSSIGQLISHNNLGEILLVQTRYAEAVDQFNLALGLFEEAGAGAAMAAFVHINLCRAHEARRDFDAARTSLDEGVRLLSKTGSLALLAEAQLQRAELELEAGNLATAARVAEDATSDIERLGSKLLNARSLRIRGLIECAAGDTAQGHEHLRCSADTAREIGAEEELAKALAALGRVDSVRGTAR